MYRCLFVLFFILMQFSLESQTRKKDAGFSIINGSKNIILASYMMTPRDSYDEYLEGYSIPLVKKDFDKGIAPDKIKPYTIKFRQPANWKNYLKKDLVYYHMYLFDNTGQIYFLVVSHNKKNGGLPVVIFTGPEIFLLTQSKLRQDVTSYSIVPRDSLLSNKEGYGVEAASGHLFASQRLADEENQPIWIKLNDFPNWRSYLRNNNMIDLDLFFYTKSGQLFKSSYLKFQLDRPNPPLIMRRNTMQVVKNPVLFAG